MAEPVEHIYDADRRLLAIIVRSSFDSRGVTFFTEPSFSQQLAFMRHPEKHKIKSHVHKPILRNVFYTQETLIIRKGKLRVHFYDDTYTYICSRTLTDGDVILLICGGHGFEVIKEVEMIEVKQGPYNGKDDKVVF